MRFPIAAHPAFVIFCNLKIFTNALSTRVVSESDLYRHAVKLMERSPLLDTHVDLPQILNSLSEYYLVGDAIDSIFPALSSAVGAPYDTCT